MSGLGKKALPRRSSAHFAHRNMPSGVPPGENRKSEREDERDGAERGRL